MKIDTLLQKNKTKIGYLFGLCFCVATAVSATMIHDTTHAIDPFYSLFFTTSLGIVYFNLANVRTIKETYVVCLESKHLWLIISLFVAGNWVTTFYSLSKIDAFVFIFTYFAASSVIGSIFSLSKERRGAELGLIAVTMMLLAFFANRVVLEQSGNVAESAVGLACAVLSALCGYGYRRYSVVFSQKTKLSASGVLSVRFYLLFVIAGALLLAVGNGQFENLAFSRFAMLTMVTFIVPLYCMQKSVLYIGAEYFSILTALCPAATSLILWCFYGIDDFLYLSLSVAIFILALIKLLSRNTIFLRLQGTMRHRNQD